MRESIQKVRHCICWLLGVALILSGRVSRGRRRAFGEDIITAICFHNPNRRLFARCIRWLLQHGYTFISSDDVAAFLYDRKPVPKGAVWISFDDGCCELVDNVLPVVRRYRIPVTLFIPSGIVEGDGLFPWLHRDHRNETPASAGASPSRDCLTLAALQEIQALPFVTLGAHTVNHAIVPACSDDEVRFELQECKRTIEAWTGAPAEYFAYPNGEYSARERPIIGECRYKLAATTENNFITRETDRLLVPRFTVADNIYTVEAICNMVGIWRPLIDALKEKLGFERERAAVGRKVLKSSL